MTQASGVVYLVDDDQGVREAISELLASLKIEHVTFGSAEEYLGYVPESGVKIAILDLDRFQSLNLAQDVISQIL